MGKSILVCGVLLLCGAASNRALAKDGGHHGFAQPPGTIAVNFSVDDRANRVYGDGDLAWKGSFAFDAATRLLAFDPYWAGPYPLLYDDGPWTRGGHEPEEARAGDNVWGVTAFVAVPSTDPLGFQYGLTDLSYDAAYGNGWMWVGDNGAFTVAPGAHDDIDAVGRTFPRFGDTDLKFTIDTGRLTQLDGWTWDTSFVGVKASWWGWAIGPLTDQGGGVYSLSLDDFLDAGYLAHTGMLPAKTDVEFVVVLGGSEYKQWVTDGVNWWTEALLGGVSVGTGCEDSGVYHDAPVTLAGDGNSTFTTPRRCDHGH